MRKKNNTITISKLIFVVLVLSFCAIVIKLSYIALAKKIDGINLSEFVANRNKKDVGNIRIMVVTGKFSAVISSNSSNS